MYSNEWMNERNNETKQNKKRYLINKVSGVNTEHWILSFLCVLLSLVCVLRYYIEWKQKESSMSFHSKKKAKFIMNLI